MKRWPAPAKICRSRRSLVSFKADGQFPWRNLTRPVPWAKFQRTLNCNSERRELQPVHEKGVDRQRIRCTLRPRYRRPSESEHRYGHCSNGARRRCSHVSVSGLRRRACHARVNARPAGAGSNARRVDRSREVRAQWRIALRRRRDGPGGLAPCARRALRNLGLRRDRARREDSRIWYRVVGYSRGRPADSVVWRL